MTNHSKENTQVDLYTIRKMAKNHGLHNKPFLLWPVIFLRKYYLVSIESRSESVSNCGGRGRSSLEVRVLLLFLMGKEFKKDEARSRVRCTVSEALYPVSTTFCEAAKKARFGQKISSVKF